MHAPSGQPLAALGGQGEGEGLAAGTVGGGERAYATRAARASAQPASGGTCRHPFRNSEIYKLFRRVLYVRNFPIEGRPKSPVRF